MATPSMHTTNKTMLDASVDMKLGKLSSITFPGTCSCGRPSLASNTRNPLFLHLPSGFISLSQLRWLVSDFKIFRTTL